MFGNRIHRFQGPQTEDYGGMAKQALVSTTKFDVTPMQTRGYFCKCSHCSYSLETLVS